MASSKKDLLQLSRFGTETDSSRISRVENINGPFDWVFHNQADKKKIRIARDQYIKSYINLGQFDMKIINGKIVDITDTMWVLKDDSGKSIQIPVQGIEKN